MEGERRDKGLCFPHQVHLPKPTSADQGILDSPGEPPPNILEMCTVFARPEVKAAWEVYIQDIVQTAEEPGVANSSAHMQIRALFTAKPKAKAPFRNSISYIIMPSTKYLGTIDPERRMTVQVHCRSAVRPCRRIWISLILCVN